MIKGSIQEEDLTIINIYAPNRKRRSQDGGGIGGGNHFLAYKFIERTTER